MLNGNYCTRGLLQASNLEKAKIPVDSSHFSSTQNAIARSSRYTGKRIVPIINYEQRSIFQMWCAKVIWYDEKLNGQLGLAINVPWL